VLPPIDYHLFTSGAHIRFSLTQKVNEMQTNAIISAVGRTTAPQIGTESERQMRTQAQALEASFLSEMLGYAGVGPPNSDFGGGIGEQQFSSFLRDEEARQMAAHGGIGLAEHLFRAMQKGRDV
jgi:peptidoglycan hydrolase FlgJ